MSNSPPEQPREQTVVRQAPLTKTWQRLISAVAFLLIIVALVVTLMNYSWPELVGFVILLIVLSSLGILNFWFPAINRIFIAIIAGYLQFIFWMLVVVAPFWAAFWLARFVIARSDTRAQIMLLIAWTVLLGAAITFISTENWRTRLFEILRRVGVFTPLAYACNVLLLAVTFFGVVTRVLMDKGVIVLEGDPEQVFDFYLWHFLDAVPLLQINETILWTEPMPYRTSAVGWLLLAFKVSVIIPVLAAFTGYWRFAREKRAQTVVAATYDPDVV